MDKKPSTSLVEVFERALESIQARVSTFCADVIPSPVAVAYSGGLDSSALLHLLHAYASKREVPLFAFHIHHGLSPNADAWRWHCEQECRRLGIFFEARQVQLMQSERDGVEQAARLSRYAALGDLCRKHGVPLLLTAHHQDDQAETVLLQLLRGSGVAGLSGMALQNTAPGLVGDAGLIIGRPLLEVARLELEDFVARYKIAYVEDESNLDVKYARNTLRHKVMPLLAECFPGFQQRFSRAARHAGSAQHLLQELAEQDLADCVRDDSVDIERLASFGQNRIDNVLRYWFAQKGLRMPTTAWLCEMREQLLAAKEDAQVQVTHPDVEIRRYRGRAFLTARASFGPSSSIHLEFKWNGESQIDFAPFKGRLYFEEADEGLSAAWLREQTLQIHYRQGGEKLKPAPNRPTRSLKHHYQSLGIPAWKRQQPLVSANGQLLFAAGIGMNWTGESSSGKPFIRLRWEEASSCK